VEAIFSGLSETERVFTIGFNGFIFKSATGCNTQFIPNDVRSSVEEYQKASELPLLFQQDYESGVGLQGMTPLGCNTQFIPNERHSNATLLPYL